MSATYNQTKEINGATFEQNTPENIDPSISGNVSEAVEAQSENSPSDFSHINNASHSEFEQIMRKKFKGLQQTVDFVPIFDVNEAIEESDYSCVNIKTEVIDADSEISDEIPLEASLKISESEEAITQNIQFKKDETLYCDNYDFTPNLVIKEENDIQSETLFCKSGLIGENIDTPDLAKKIPCDICGRRMLKKNLRAHLRLHTGERPYGCDRCEKRFPCKSDMLKHIRRIHLSNKLYNCDICQMQFRVQIQLREHFFSMHPGEKLFSCDKCGKRFGERRYLQRHFVIHSGEKPFACYHCDKTFARKDNLNLHLKTIYRQKLLKCDKCDKRFGQSAELRKHFIRIHTGIKPFGCILCNKRFVEKTDLKKHMRKHTGERPFSCDKCQRRFSHQSNYNKHLRTHLEEKNFSCDICHRKFTQSADLRMHILRTHADDRPFGCDKCDKKFALQCDLNRHLKRHSDKMKEIAPNSSCIGTPVTQVSENHIVTPVTQVSENHIVTPVTQVSENHIVTPVTQVSENHMTRENLV